MPGEFDFISWIHAQQRPHKSVRVGIGDDLAVLNLASANPASPPRHTPGRVNSGGAPGRADGRSAEDLLLVGVDQVLDGRHFDSTLHSPESIGRKAMNRNLSDCAAMGCLPAAAVIALALPADYGQDRARQLFSGIAAAADPHYCPIVGGDTSTWPGKLAISVTILGRSLGVAPVLRTGAAVGDGIYVTGPLGGSILGRHMTFSPRLDLGRQLATYRPLGNPCIHAMLDLSDGLLQDLPHLLAPSNLHPQLGAKLDPTRIPLHPDALELSKTSGHPPLHHALTDGEDYELLFTSPVQPPVGIRIGTITAAPGILLGDTPAPRGGWEHAV